MSRPTDNIVCNGRRSPRFYLMESFGTLTVLHWVAYNLKIMQVWLDKRIKDNALEARNDQIVGRHNEPRLLKELEHQNPCRPNKSFRYLDKSLSYATKQ